MRVYAIELAKELGLSEDETEALRAASVLHDIGKLAVPEHIISKPGRLTPEEFDKMKIHPIVGAEILDGVERYQISSSLLLVVAQRLVRVLCKECSEPYAATGAELNEIGLEFEPGSRIYRAVGCEVCDDTGYQGRTGIFELLVMDEELRKALNDGANEQILHKMASGKGLRSYYCDGAEKFYWASRRWRK